MALRIGPLRSSALQNDGLDAPVILQCRTPQETNPQTSHVVQCSWGGKLDVQSTLHVALASPVRTKAQIYAHTHRMFGLGPSSRDRKTGYTKTGYMEEETTRVL